MLPGRRDKVHLIQGQCAVNQIRQDVRDIVVHEVGTGILPGGANAFPAYVS